ncbi:MAG: hypothetical protein ACTS80_00300 [Candidatus Hodgkinia cicadicola]
MRFIRKRSLLKVTWGFVVVDGELTSSQMRTMNETIGGWEQLIQHFSFVEENETSESTIERRTEVMRIAHGSAKLFVLEVKPLNGKWGCWNFPLRSVPFLRGNVLSPPRERR